MLDLGHQRHLITALQTVHKMSTKGVLNLDNQSRKQHQLRRKFTITEMSTSVPNLWSCACTQDCNFLPLVRAACSSCCNPPTRPQIAAKTSLLPFLTSPLLCFTFETTQPSIPATCRPYDPPNLGYRSSASSNCTEICGLFLREITLQTMHKTAQNSSSNPLPQLNTPP